MLPATRGLRGPSKAELFVGPLSLCRGYVCVLTEPRQCKPLLNLGRCTTFNRRATLVALALSALERMRELDAKHCFSALFHVASLVLRRSVAAEAEALFSCSFTTRRHVGSPWCPSTALGLGSHNVEVGTRF